MGSWRLDPHDLGLLSCVSLPADPRVPHKGSAVISLGHGLGPHGGGPEAPT